MPFGIIMTGLGVISTAGVVVNNAIVLIDFIDVLKERDGLSLREALVQAGKIRFRPVILGAITTASGLIPLAIGFNFDFIGLYGQLDPGLYWGGEQVAWWGNMSIAVIVGLSFATVLTLLLVPVMYSLIEDLGHFFERHYLTHEGPIEDAVLPEVHVEPTRPRRRRIPVEAFSGLWTRFGRPAEEK
jgi:multidrug efflux pump subunit AcrB